MVYYGEEVCQFLRLGRVKELYVRTIILLSFVDSYRIVIDVMMNC